MHGIWDDMHCLLIFHPHSLLLHSLEMDVAVSIRVERRGTEATCATFGARYIQLSVFKLKDFDLMNFALLDVHRKMNSLIR